MRFQRVGIFWVPSNWLRDDWLISRRVAKLFFLSAICGLASTPIFVELWDPTKVSFWVRFPLTILVMLGTVAAFFLWLGMLRYWVRLDDSRVWAKRAWFLVLLLGFPYGSFLYYFCVFLPRVIRRRVET